MLHLDDRTARKRSQFRGAFLGCVLGDAAGHPFEMMAAGDRRMGPALDAMLERDRRWVYTDDTQMMISVAESLLRMGRVCRDDLLATLAANYDPARGYGHGMRLALEAYRDGRPPASASWADGSKGNGGAVRVVPIAGAYLDDPNLLAAFAEESAGTTHAHPMGRAGAVAHALALREVLEQDPEQTLDGARLVARITHARAVAGTVIALKLEAALRLAQEKADATTAAAVLGNGVLAEESVPLALFSFLRFEPDFTNVVTRTILAGGDTDTISAMSGALCGARCGEEGLPPAWLARVETREKGISYVKDLADAVFGLWRKQALALA